MVPSVGLAADKNVVFSSQPSTFLVFDWMLTERCLPRLRYNGLLEGRQVILFHNLTCVLAC
jgi:hypothetical protein